MSSAVYIDFNEQPVDLTRWEKFCKDHEISYSPCTVGKNVYYIDDVEIHFGEPNYDELPKLPNGKFDFSVAKPFNKANKIIISSYWMHKLLYVAAVASSIYNEFNGIVTSDPELEIALKSIGFDCIKQQNC